MKLPDLSKILKLIKRPSYRPMRAREISKRLGVPKENRKVVKKMLRKLVYDGTLTRVRGGRYILSNEESHDHKAVREERSPSSAIPSFHAQTDGKILGKFIRTGKNGVIMPRNGKMPPVVVKLSEVKGLRSESLVVAEVPQGSTRSSRPVGTVVEVLGKAGNLDVEKKAILVRYDLKEDFPSDVLKESEQVPLHARDEDLSGRVDLRGMLTFTIDNDKAKDFDDAVSISRLGSGYKLLVSIADVSHYVKIGSALDNEALQRGTSIYLPERVIPMLPEKLSNHICSLVPNDDRLTKTAEIDFDNQGLVVDFKIYNSVIKSRARLTYTQVSQMLEKKERPTRKDRELIESLRIMKELYQEIRARSLERGEISFDLPEPELIRDELGRTVDVIKSHRSIAHGIIEEFMISANNVVAEYILRSDNSSIYRIHEPPDFTSIQELAMALKKMGYTLPVGNRLKASHIQQVVFESKGTPEQLAVHTMILRSLKRAVYSTKVEGHFGLALKHYTHFTSPIRRYPDLIVHRIINSLINGRKVSYDQESLDWIAEHSSVKERFADEVEREGTNLERAYMMKSHVGKEFNGFVISILPFGIFVELKDFFVEGFVPREKIRKGKWFEIGNEVRVRVTEADVERRRITLDLVS